MPSGERSAITMMAALLTLLISTSMVVLYDDATSIPSRGRGQTETQAQAARQVGQEGRQMPEVKKDFHVYVQPDAAGVDTVNLVMDPADPQRAEVLEAVAAIMNKAGRSREYSECLKAKNW